MEHTAPSPVPVEQIAAGRLLPAGVLSAIFSAIAKTDVLAAAG